MDKKLLAEQLNGLSYPMDQSANFKKLVQIAATNRLVIVCGGSDDRMEFYGAIDDEIGCYEGCSALVDNIGLLPSRDSIDQDDESLHFWLHRKQKAKSITATWGDEDGPTWRFATNIPHETFDIMESGDVFCRGIVFLLDSLS
jgi:hypothetical protein